MSLTEIIAELPALSVAERQILVRRALDLDEPALSHEEEVEVERRLAGHHADPASSIPLENIKNRLRNRFAG